MTTPIHPDIPPQKISCSVLLKEVPLSLVTTPDGADYIEHFGGTECYVEFVAQHQAAVASQRKK